MLLLLGSDDALLNGQNITRGFPFLIKPETSVISEGWSTALRAGTRPSYFRLPGVHWRVHN
jgi:hypothetical protein